ncbi:MAG: gamma-glutamyltransferase, partial [Pseudomonadota bacterium]
MHLLKTACSALLAVTLGACGAGTDSTATSPAIKSDWPHGAMVAAADPRAVSAGLEVLQAGGHAVDAAIAVHTVLGLVEPQ